MRERERVRSVPKDCKDPQREKKNENQSHNLFSLIDSHHPHRDDEEMPNALDTTSCCTATGS